MNSSMPEIEAEPKVKQANSNILVVDDEPAILELLVEILKQEGLQVIPVDKGEEALRLLKTDNMDAILLDVKMPGMSGITLLEKTKKIYPDIEVIMMSGYANLDSAIEALKFGAFDYIKKPFNGFDVARVLKRALEKRRLRLENIKLTQGLKKRVHQLEVLNSEIQSFYQTASHELKTPLTSVREYIAMTLDGLAGPLNVTQRKFLEISKESCDQMVVYINDFLDVTRLQTGKLIIHPASISIRRVVSQAIASISPTAQKKQILLTHQIEPDMPELQIDKKRMTQVLTNLLSNALKFTPEGGDVCIKVSQDPNNSEFILVSVSDTGRGIEPEHLERIFERLYQVRTSDSMTDGGLGLGLHICKELVNLHGGKIWVKSQPGGGSTFFFTIPKHLPKETTNRITEKGKRDEKDSHN